MNAEQIKAANKKAARPHLAWRNCAEQVVVPKSPFILDRLIYQAASHGLIAKPKVGKTTFTLDACEAILNGNPFLKCDTTPTSILYVSEQPLNSFAAELANSGVFARKPLFDTLLWFITIEDWFHVDWPGIVEMSGEQAAKCGARLVIFDTLSRIARVENENDASEMQNAVDEMTPLIKAGVATLAIQHERKAGGDIFDAGRGTNALTGAVDALIRLHRPSGAYPATYRQLEYIGRFPGPPDSLIIERKTSDAASRYAVVGNPAVVRRLSNEQKVLDLWSNAPDSWLREEQIIEMAQLVRSTVKRTIASLIDDGLLEIRGKGINKSPHEFRAKCPESNGHAPGDRVF